jgi:NADH:ubiquinone oxidoreductase subunit E
MNPGASTAAITTWQKKIASKFEPLPRYLIPALQYVQSEEGYLPPEAMTAVSRHLCVSESKVFGVASFYSLFHLEPRGKHTVTVCRGTACHVRGSASILKELEKKLQIAAGETTEDFEISLETVACFGSCALAPVVVTDMTVHGRQTKQTATTLVDGLRPESGSKRTSNKASKKKQRS